MYAEKPEEMKEWVDAIGRSISKLSQGRPPVAVATPPVVTYVISLLSSLLTFSLLVIMEILKIKNLFSSLQQICLLV